MIVKLAHPIAVDTVIVSSVVVHLPPFTGKPAKRPRGMSEYIWNLSQITWLAPEVTAQIDVGDAERIVDAYCDLASQACSAMRKITELAKAR